jgi:hypothetical protein
MMERYIWITLPTEIDESDNHKNRVQIELLLRAVSPTKWEWFSIFSVESNYPIDDKSDETVQKNLKMWLS